MMIHSFIDEKYYRRNIIILLTLRFLMEMYCIIYFDNLQQFVTGFCDYTAVYQSDHFCKSPLDISPLQDRINAWLPHLLLFLLFSKAETLNGDYHAFALVFTDLWENLLGLLSSSFLLFQMFYARACVLRVAIAWWQALRPATKQFLLSSLA